MSQENDKVLNAEKGQKENQKIKRRKLKIKLKKKKMKSNYISLISIRGF